MPGTPCHCTNVSLPKSGLLFPKQFHHFPHLLYYHFNLQIESLPETEATKKVHPPPSNFILVLPVL